MRKPTARLIDAIVRLKNDADFMLVSKWFDDSFNDDAVASLHMPDEPQRSWSQGRAHTLEDIIKIIKDADNILVAANKQGGE